MLYSPSWFTVAGRRRPFCSSRTVMEALFTTPPFGSLTVTCRSPVATPWPRLKLVSRSNGTSSDRQSRSFIDFPLVAKSRTDSTRGVEAKFFGMAIPSRVLHQFRCGNQGKLLSGTGFISSSRLVRWPNALRRQSATPRPCAGYCGRFRSAL